MIGALSDRPFANVVISQLSEIQRLRADDALAAVRSRRHDHERLLRHAQAATDVRLHRLSGSGGPILYPAEPHRAEDTGGSLREDDHDEPRN